MSRKILIYFSRRWVGQAVNSKCCYHQIGLLSLPDVQSQWVRKFSRCFPTQYKSVVLFALISFSVFSLFEYKYIISTFLPFVKNYLRIPEKTLRRVLESNQLLSLWMCFRRHLPSLKFDYLGQSLLDSYCEIASTNLCRSCLPALTSVGSSIPKCSEICATNSAFATTGSPDLVVLGCAW